MLRRKAIIHRDHKAAAFIGKRAAESIVTIQIAHHETTAVEIDDRGQRRAARGHRRIDAQTDRALGARGLDVFRLADGGRFDFRELAEPFVILADFGGGFLPHRIVRQIGHGFEQGLNHGIERHEASGQFLRTGPWTTIKSLSGSFQEILFLPANWDGQASRCGPESGQTARSHRDGEPHRHRKSAARRAARG